MSILDYIERIKRENEGPRITAQEPRIGLKPGGIVEPGVVNYGKTWDVPPEKLTKFNLSQKIKKYAAIKKVYDEAKKTGNWNIFKSDARGTGGELKMHYAQELNKLKTGTPEFTEFAKWMGTTESALEKNLVKRTEAVAASKSAAATKTALNKPDVILQNKMHKIIMEGPSSVDDLAKALDISKKKTLDIADKLYTNIYSQRVVMGKGKYGARMYSVFLPKEDAAIDTLLKNLGNTKGLRATQQENIGTLFYNAFGRETLPNGKKNPSFSRKKYSQMLAQLDKYNSIKELLPKGIKLNLDHPLSKMALKSMDASADQLVRVTPISESLNKGLKLKFDTAYANALKSKDVTKQKAVQKLSKQLGINIGKVTEGGAIRYGTKDFRKLDLAQTIIDNLKQQNVIAENLKKVDPGLKKAAGMKKYKFKIDATSKKDLKSIAKILSDNGFKCKLAGGLTCNDPRAYINSINEQKALMQAGDKTAAKLFARTGNAMLKIGSKAARVAFSPALLWGEPFLEGAFIAHDMLGNKTPWKEAVSKSYLTIPLRAMGLMKTSEEYQAADMIEVRDDEGNVTGVREGVKTYIDARSRLSELDRLQNKVSNLEQQKETNVDLYGADNYHKMLTDAKKELSGHASAIQREGGEKKFMGDMKLNEKAYRERKEVMLTKRMEGKKYKEDSTRVFYELDDPRFREMEEYKMGREDVTGFMSRAEYEKFQELVPELKNVSYEDMPKFMEYTSMLKKRMPGSYPGQRIGQVFPTPASKYGWDLTGEIARAGGVANMATGGLANLTRTVAPDSGPMSQGLRSLYIDDKDY